MDIWTIKANEPMPIVNQKQRLFRMGLLNKELAKRGHNVTWFQTTFDHFTKKQLYDNDTIINVQENYNLHIIWSPSYKKNISVKRIINHKYLALKLKKEMNKLKKPDLIYVAFPTIDLAEQAIKYGKKNKIPVIIDIRDLWPDTFKQNLSGIKKLLAIPYIKIMNKKTKDIMKNAYALTSISPKMLEWGLKKANRKKNKNDQFFYIGYEKIRNEEENLEQNFKVNIDVDKFNVAFSGTINNQYNYELLVEVAKILEKENIDFYICGDGTHYNKLVNLSRKTKNIKFLGWIEKNEMDYVLRKSKIGIAPYKNTFDFQMSVSNKFSEYLSYGLPTIITSSGYMKEFAEKNNCGFSSSEPIEISKYILKLKNNEKMYNEISKNARNTYKQNFIAEEIYINLTNYIEMVYECI